MLWIGVDLGYSRFFSNWNWSMSWITLTHLDLCQCHINKKWMRNVVPVNVTIQPYFLLSFRDALMQQICYTAPFKKLSFTDWIGKICHFLFLYDETFHLYVPLFEQDRTIIVLRRNKKCLRNINTAPPSVQHAQALHIHNGKSTL